MIYYQILLLELIQEKSKGMEVNEVDKSAFVEAVQPVWDTFKKENGSELIDLAVSYND